MKVDFNSAATTALADATLGSPVVIEALGLDELEAAWVEAVGLSRGARVVVLRRAPLGGPLHVRTSDGAELAVARSLARAITVSAVLEGGAT